MSSETVFSLNVATLFDTLQHQKAFAAALLNLECQHSPR